MKSLNQILAATLCVMACAGTGTASASQSIDQRVPADLHGTIEINNTSGTVHCIGWDKPEIQITGELSSSAERLDVQTQGKTVSIRVLQRMGIASHGDNDLEIKAPFGSSLRISGVNADINVRGITGEQRLQSVSGDVETEAAAADLVLKSISGNLKLRGKNNPLRTTVSTVSGNISLVNVGGELDLDTVSGDVDIDMNTVTRARMKTISGDMGMVGRLSADSRIDLSTVSGNLHMRWPGAEKANVEVENFSGDITSCFGNVEVQRPKYGPGSSWRYGVSGATSDIHIKSMSGDVSVCNR